MVEWLNPSGELVLNSPQLIPCSLHIHTKLINTVFKKNLFLGSRDWGGNDRGSRERIWQDTFERLLEALVGGVP